MQEGGELWYTGGMKRIVFFLVSLCFGACSWALSEELQARVEEAQARGYAYLRDQQAADGSWSDRRFPGMSALALWSMARAGLEENAVSMERASEYIASCAQPDGGLYVPIPNRRGGGLGNYNTCLCLTALHAANGKDKYLKLLLAARAYIASTQIEAEGVHEGGFGYDKSSPRAYTDLNNTFYAVDAMRLTQDLEESRPVGQKRVEIDWDAARQYVLSMQVTEGDEAGGFLYNRELPQKPKEGETPVVKLRAYGSMSYAGLLAMLHCELSREDPRVRSTYQYLAKHWTLEENPGQGNQGLYFYYEVLARALDAAGMDTIVREDGTMIDWRAELAEALLKRQQADGSWVNESNRFWEGDPVLSTSYALLALSFVVE